MADDYQLEEEFTMEPHYEKEFETESTSGEQASTVLEIQTPLGPVSIDMKQYDDIKSTVAATRKKASSMPIGDQMMHGFLGGKHKRDSRYWAGKLGAMMKMHFDEYLEEEYEVVEEFLIDHGKIRAAVYETVEMHEKQRQRFLAVRTRFYKSKTNPENLFVTVSSVDHDGDQRFQYTLCRINRSGERRKRK